MAKYFKMVKISKREFVEKTGENLGCYTQSVVPVEKEIFVAIDEEREYEIQIPLDYFE